MTKSKKLITCDGNYAAAHIAYMFSEVSAIYPITPSSTMAELVDEWAAEGRKNIFNQPVKVVEMQSEAGAAGAVHGSLQSGALTSTYTASQGLLLMIPNMYKISGELLPAVFHVTARALASQALSIFGDHQDVMATRQTGFAILASGGVQEVMDLAAVSHLVAIKGRIPFMHMFDGFRTSHEIQKIEMLEQEDLKPLLDMSAVKLFRERALNPEHPVARGMAQNPDIYFQAREASNPFYDAIPDLVEDAMKQISSLTGREYAPFNYYGAKDAENIIIAMGSVTDTIKEVIDYKLAQGEKIGMIAVHLYRPFSAKHFLKAIPTSVKRICVLDRTKEPGANGEPIYLDVRDIFYEKKDAPMIIGGRYGLSSKDTTPAQIISVYENLAQNEPKNRFTLGIIDDVTFTSLPVGEEISMNPNTFEARFIGLGSDGTVGANKNSIKIIGGSTDKYCQAYFAYDSKKSGGYTSSHLRFGDTPINSTYLVTTPNFVGCHVPSYLGKYDLLSGLKDGGTFLLNSVWDAETTKKHIPADMKRYMAKHNISFFIINATKIADELGLGSRTNTIMQSAFFKVANVIPYDMAVEEMKKAIYKSYGMKGEDVIKKNYAAVEAGAAIEKIEIPASWADAKEDTPATSTLPEFVETVCAPINALKGDSLPVSAFKGREDGTWEVGTAQYEKRGIAAFVPEWDSEACIQCNQCAYICPHAAIRPFLPTKQEVENAPKGIKCAEGKGQLKDYMFTIQVTPLDCTGCGNCANICPAPTKALHMKPLKSQLDQQPVFDYLHSNVGYKEVVDKAANVKNSQFAQPLFEFSGACAGCGETPYIKTITQLFGDRMMIANATGCSSIYGGSAPSTPYRANKDGKGPAWANSLFEDNAEYGMGMRVSVDNFRERIKLIMQEAIEKCDKCDKEIKELFGEWITNIEDSAMSVEVSNKLIPLLEKSSCTYCADILDLKQYLIKKSVWIFGGDGWAYDIGYGGLDHVMASGENVNVLVMDTEIYSNTGGQSSKATPIGAVAKFASAGKRIRKKDLGAMMMIYGYVYVAQVAVGANHAQYFKAVREAEAYNGPSIIIAYSPCISHGIKGGMGMSQMREKEAVECGYWHLWRFNPELIEKGENPFIIDSKEPTWDKFQDFINAEVRYSSLRKLFPEQADELFNAAEKDAKWRYDSYVRYKDMSYNK